MESATVDDVAATVEHVKKCNPDLFLTTVSYPIKNTAYYHQISGSVSLDRDWADATDRDYRILNRPAGNSYQHADRWLKSDVAAARRDLEDPSAAARLREEAAREREMLRANLTTIQT